MQKFSILSPILGIKQDKPIVPLEQAFSPENSNVQLWRDVVRKANLRQNEFYRNTYLITARDTGAKTITIAGDHTSEFKDNDVCCVYRQTDAGGVITKTVIYAALTLNGDSTGSTIIAVDEAITNVAVNDYIYIVKDALSGATASVGTDLKVPMPDGFPVMRYHTYTSAATGTEYLFAFTKSHIYLWNSITRKWTKMHTCASYCTTWDTEDFNNAVIATNYVDSVLRWRESTPGTAFAAFGTTTGIPSLAKYVCAYEGYLFLGYIYNGGAFPSRIQWCDIWDEDTWNSGDADTGDMEGNDAFAGFGKKGTYLILFKERSIHKLWLVETDDIFNKTRMPGEIGCKGHQAIVNDANGNLFFFGSDNQFRELDNGILSDFIPATIEYINPTYANGIQATWISEYKEVWFAVPYGLSQTTNNKILVLGKSGMGHQLDIPISAFGHYGRGSTGYTWDNPPFSTWDSISEGIPWDSAISASAFVIDLSGDYSGYAYAVHSAQTDNDVAYTAYFTLATNLQAPESGYTGYKRLLTLGFWVYSENAADIATISIKRDGESAWQSAGQVSIYNSNNQWTFAELPVDFRARNFQVKFLSSSYFRFFGIVFGWVRAGER